MHFSKLFDAQSLLKDLISVLSVFADSVWLFIFVFHHSGPLLYGQNG
jgi:hypothetical protein